MVEYGVSETDGIVGTRVRDLGLPQSALVMLIVRNGRAIPPRGSTTVEAGDRLYVLVGANERARVEALLDRWEHEQTPADTAPRPVS